MPDEASDAIRALAEQRARAREERDFALADTLRDRIAGEGWVVIDESDGWRLIALERPLALRPQDVVSRLGEPPAAEVSIHWVCEGWPQDIARAVASFRAHAGGRRIQFVVADVTDAGAGAFGDDVEVLRLEPGSGWAAACNAGLVRSAGDTVLVMDGSIEAAGDVIEVLDAALDDPTVGLAGPFGIVTHDLREFEELSGPGDCDAVEGYCMAMRRPLLTEVGLFDEKFRWYRSADIEFSFRVKDAGLRTVVVPSPVIEHEHRMWHGTASEERDRLSKRNYYRFLERWRDRWDLVLDPRPPAADDS